MYQLIHKSLTEVKRSGISDNFIITLYAIPCSIKVDYNSLFITKIPVRE
nr:MAG TPA: hypothetical protein [Crassvirales sp.]